MLGFIEQDLHARLRISDAVPYARRTRAGRYVLEIAAPEGVYLLQRQRGGAREFKTFEALLKLMASHAVVEFAVILDDATVSARDHVAPWNRPTQKEGTSSASWRHDFGVPF